MLAFCHQHLFAVGNMTCEGLPQSQSAGTAPISMPNDVYPLLMRFFTRRVQQHKDEHSDVFCNTVYDTTIRHDGMSVRKTPLERTQVPLEPDGVPR